jgi:hypothetical protein
LNLWRYLGAAASVTYGVDWKQMPAPRPAADGLGATKATSRRRTLRWRNNDGGPVGRQYNERSTDVRDTAMNARNSGEPRDHRIAQPASMSSLLRSAIIELTSAETAAIESPADQAREAIPDAGSNRRDRFDVTRLTGRAWYLISSYS